MRSGLLATKLRFPALWSWSLAGALIAWFLLYPGPILLDDFFGMSIIQCLWLDGLFEFLARFISMLLS